MTNKEIESFNKIFGINTVFYYDDKSVCGYEENNTIYLNLNSNKDLEKVNMHELLHFYEETEVFKKIKERVISSLKENKEFDKLKEEYELKYFGIYSLEEIEKGIIDNEIVIDVLVGDYPYFKKEDLDNLCTEILISEKKETDRRRYLILNMNNNIENMNLSKWEKMFASNYYRNKNYDGSIPMFPSDNKELTIKEDIQKELNKLYNLTKEDFIIDLDSVSLIREYESELKALEQRGEKNNADYIRNNKTKALEELSNVYSEKLYEEYKHIVDFIKTANYEDAFKVLMLRETLLKVYKKDNDKVIVKQRKLNETIEGHMLLNDTVLKVIHDNLDKYKNFKELYYAGVAEFNNIIKDASEVTLENVNTYGMGKWIKFNGRASDSENYAENVIRLKTLVQDTPWCTKTLASTQLEQGDFYVFVDNSDKPHIAVKMNGNEIDEERGIKNGNAQELEEEYRDVALSFLENNKEIQNGKEWLDKEEWNKRLIEYNKKIENGTFKSEECGNLIEDLLHMDYRSHFNKNSNLEELRGKLCKIKNNLAEYYNCTEEEICMGDYEPKTEMTCPYKIILGNANFDGSKVTNLGNLQIIGGSVDFHGSKITSLGNLESIGGFAEFKFSEVTSLGNLQNIGGSADFRYSEITDLGNLQNIGGSADFRYSEITDLGNLQNIGGSADFRYSEITDLGNLQHIGEGADFSNSKVTSLGNLESIGEYAYFDNSKITDLGNLESIGEYADFRDSEVTDLGNLQHIGENADFSNSEITDLGNLQHIGGEADFNNSKVTSLGNLQHIGENADFSNSEITDLGNLQHIGGEADFNNSKVTDLGNIEHIGGKIITDENNAYLKEEYEQRIKNVIKQ